MEKRSESFGRHLKAGMAAVAYLEGKTQQAIEEELGGLIGVAGVTLQRYKSGYIPPDPTSAERLAEACVQRGLLGRLWLERFLSAARYPAYSSRALVAQLMPETSSVQAQTMRPNLPPPTYTHFVMRHDAFKATMAGLCSSLPVTLIVSLGGMGKTSLARAVAGECLEHHDAALHVAAVVWVSDKDRPGTTNLSTTLEEIARVLDYPGLTALPFAERRREVEYLLSRQPILLVVDNAETITDDALLNWLDRLPNPSKALVTSRFALPALTNAYLVELGPMAAGETRALITEWLPRSRLRGIPGVLEQLALTAEIVGGNAKAIELVLGLLQHRTHDEVVAELSNARPDLFNDLFTSAWNLLDGAARSVLLALPLFPASAAAEALAYCADLSLAALQRSADQLISLSLLDSERTDVFSAPRYNAHPLVRAYARAHFAQLPFHEQARLRERWLSWCVDIALSVGFCWDDLDRLDTLDREHEVLQAAVMWAAEHAHDQAVIALTEGVRYYYNVRGLWGDEELNNHERRAVAAQRLQDRDNEVLALAHHIEVLSKQGRIDEAMGRMNRLVQVVQVNSQSLDQLSQHELSEDAAFEYGHALALYARAQGNLGAAEAHWRDLLTLSQTLGGQKYVVNRRWLATVLLEQGQIPAARQLYAESLEDARHINDIRSVTGNMLKLAAIDLQRDDLATAAATLEDCRTTALRHHDRRRLAEWHWLAAQLLARQGDGEGAVNELELALDLFERLGMRREATQAREAISALTQLV